MKGEVCTMRASKGIDPHKMPAAAIRLRPTRADGRGGSRAGSGASPARGRGPADGDWARRDNDPGIGQV
ncbi:MAG: hypothetical protein Kow00122_12000 [Thermoleophilia bacterium]